MVRLPVDLNGILNDLIQRVARRAEMSDPERLQKTFVEVRQITAAMRSIDHGVVYGRRGTGKTHAFTHLGRKLEDGGDLTILIDLRRIGSNGGLYADVGEQFSLRASQLLIDVVEEIHNRLFVIAVDENRFSGLLNQLDALGQAATSLRVEGPIERVEEKEEERKSDKKTRWELGATWPSGLSGNANSAKTDERKDRRKCIEKRTGSELPRLRFGQLGRALEQICGSIAPARMWLLLDEWSSVPLDLQPILADMLKRVFFTCPGLTVKIGAIERRSCFVQRNSTSNYVGIELGADTGAALNLDEHLVNPDELGSVVNFYDRVLQKHLAIMAEEIGMPWPVPVIELKKMMFEGDAFLWLVRAAEGVPRDAINILGLAASYARKRKIRSADIQRAARTYYLQDKEKGIVGNRIAEEVWDILQREVVLQKRSRTFLLSRVREQMSTAMLDLYDARLIHLLKPGLTAPSRPGVTYDGYAVDYGSYVNVLKEIEIDAAWQASGRPRIFRGEDAFLPDRFDESVIFTPSRARLSEGMRRSR
jgi:hypothetical protein